jgi:hypothetical protein
MTLVNRSELRTAMRGWIAASEEMRSLEQAMKKLYPKRRPSVATMAETVLFSVIHAHEGETHSTITNLNNAMARLLDDLAALRGGQSIEGRTAGMHAADLAVIAKAMDDLDVLQAKIKYLLENDSGAAMVDQLKNEMAPSLKGGSKRPAGAIPPVTKPKLAVPASFEHNAAALGDALAAAAPTPHGIWNKGKLPATVRDAAHNLVVAAGGDVAAAVRKLVQRGGPEADAMIIAVLWAEKKIAPGSELAAGVDHAAHQTAVTGLTFEWTGKPAKVSMGESIGIDGIAGGLVVDAKHSNVPVETLSHLTDEIVPAKPNEPFWMKDVEPTVDRQVKDAFNFVDIAAAQKKIFEEQHGILEQMSRQLDWAREHGLKGINWVCNDGAHADAFRQLANRLPAQYKDMQILFTVGGLR